MKKELERRLKDCVENEWYLDAGCLAERLEKWQDAAKYYCFVDRIFHAKHILVDKCKLSKEDAQEKIEKIQAEKPKLY